MDRRLYQRILCNVECLLIFTNEKILPREIEDIIVDISESELRISFDKSNPSRLLSRLNVNDPVHFHAYEEYEVFGEKKDALLSGDAVIVRLYGDAIFN